MDGLRSNAPSTPCTKKSDPFALKLFVSAPGGKICGFRQSRFGELVKRVGGAFLRAAKRLSNRSRNASA
jgi:hypothetical protein